MPRLAKLLDGVTITIQNYSHIFSSRCSQFAIDRASSGAKKLLELALSDPSQVTDAMREDFQRETADLFRSIGAREIQVCKSRFYRFTALPVATKHIRLLFRPPWPPKSGPRRTRSCKPLPSWTSLPMPRGCGECPLRLFFDLRTILDFLGPLCPS